jgi:hypothetical protein
MKLEQERKTIEAMIRLYCRGQHGTGELCEECSELLGYANARLSKCPFGEDKPKCAKCEVHCYKPEMRKRVTAVMKYSGPRMMVHHPVMALRHLLHEGPPSAG